MVEAVGSSPNGWRGHLIWPGGLEERLRLAAECGRLRPRGQPITDVSHGGLSTALMGGLLEGPHDLTRDALIGMSLSVRKS